MQEAVNPFDYMKPTEAILPVIQATREAFKTAHAHLMTLPESRERSIAVTKLEEASMWAVKGLVFGAGNVEASGPVAEKTNASGADLAAGHAAEAEIGALVGMTGPEASA